VKFGGLKPLDHHDPQEGADWENIADKVQKSCPNKS